MKIDYENKIIYSNDNIGDIYHELRSKFDLWNRSYHFPITAGTTQYFVNYYELVYNWQIKPEIINKPNVNRFDIEDNIMSCWNITNDLDTLIENYDIMTIDEQLNVLIGIKDLYNVKFDSLFKNYEQLIKENKL